MRKIIIFIVISFSVLFAKEKPVVLITGASKGVGFSTVKYFAEKGFIVYGTVRRPEMLSLDMKNINFILVDLQNLISVESAVQQIIEKEGKIDVLINNAGYAVSGPMELIKDEEMKEQMDVNFFAPIRFTQAVLPSMRKQKQGRIINVGSVDGMDTTPFGGMYSASKAALESFTEALRVEVDPYNIFVSIIEPNYIQTKFCILLGTREIPDNPYKDIMEQKKIGIKERNNHPELLPNSQTPEEIAEFLYNIVQDPNPKLRYQTSEKAKQYVSLKLADLTGEKYLNSKLSKHSP